MALEALERHKPKISEGSLPVLTHDAAITALRAAIEQAGKQEPYIAVNKDRITIDPVTGNVSIGIPAAPHQWVGLTDEEIMEMLDYGQYGGRVPTYARNFVDAIEAKLKEKNDVLRSV